ncbi:pilus assembly protein [Vibrio sp. MarTm2]|uniref:TadE/TadG family type IV pilus assembly protein n=1 Tax=Vibrio sp. MarTm2 TaxID=2998831 RepID=UPI0022CDB6AB|nr:TadE family protein [Vibrio sp. MarTm2]MDA0127748.1 pilus assembly protein [Vibrio sp. MarTm2]
MIKKVRSFYQRGIASIEFALGFMAFWLMCMAWVEMSYLSYVSAISDLAISEAARSAKVSKGNYKQSFSSVIDDSNALWSGVVDESNFRMSVNYIRKVADLTNVNPCEVPDGDTFAECGIAANSAMAIYRVDYDFNSIFTFFIDTSNLVSREVIVVQEYERDAF